MSEQTDGRDDLESRLEKDWGPDTSRRKRLVSAVIIITAFLALVVAALITATK